MPTDYNVVAWGLVVVAPSPATSGTSLTLSAGQGARFRSGTQNSMAIVYQLSDPGVNECIVITDRTGDVFTITRNFDGRGAQSITASGWALHEIPLSVFFVDADGHVALGYRGAIASETFYVTASKDDSWVMADFGFVNTGAGSPDSGALRARAQTSVGSPALRAGEFQVLRGTGAANGAGWGIEIGVHSEIAGDGVNHNNGIVLMSNHAGWLPSGVRADVALKIYGVDGWTHFLRFYDTDDTTVLFNVDQDGNLSLAGTITAPRTRSFFLDATRFMAGDGTPDLAIRGSTANAYEKAPAWAFDPAALESILTTFSMPADWNNGAIRLYAYWAPSTTNNGNVFWNFVAAGIASATQIDQALEMNFNPGVQAASGTAENLHIKDMGSLTPDSALIRLAAARQGADGADTYTGDAWLLGVLVEYTATQ